MPSEHGRQAGNKKLTNDLPERCIGELKPGQAAVQLILRSRRRHEAGCNVALPMESTNSRAHACAGRCVSVAYGEPVRVGCQGFCVVFRGHLSSVLKCPHGYWWPKR